MKSGSINRFFRFHPVTGQDANDIDTSGATQEHKTMLAEMVSAGAKFYWEESPVDAGGFGRVEHSNVKFVLDMTGAKYEFVDTK